MTRTRHRTGVLLSIGAIALLIGGCGSDDDAATAADVSAVCDALIEIDQTVPTGGATKEDANGLLDSAIAAADAETATMLTELKDTMQPVLDDPDADPGEEFFAVYNESLVWIGDNCEVETLDVTAVDYEFSGLPDEMDAGYNIVNFTNDGQEEHELVAVRINDDVDLSIDEILALPEEESEAMIRFVGASFASAGESTVGSLDLTEPGRYVVVCFIPVGTVGETEGDGPPHALEGMTTEITVQ
jgi:hypothetical protein